MKKKRGKKLVRSEKAKKLARLAMRVGVPKSWIKDYPLLKLKLERELLRNGRTEE